MHAASASTTTSLVDRTIPHKTRPLLLAPAKRKQIDRIFAEEIVLCMNKGRLPTSHEVQAVAARIWDDIQIGSPKIPWCEIVPGCHRYRQIVAAARAALGDTRSDGKPA